MRKPLVWLHATFGIILSAYLLVAAASGALLMFKAEILAAAHPALASASASADPLARAETLVATIDAPTGSIKLPDDTLNAFTARFPNGGTALYNPETLARQPDHYGLVAAFDWLFDLHHHLLAGDTGELVSGICGLALVGMIVTGIFLWWPRWRKWRPKHLWPRNRSRAQRLNAHQSLAALTIPLLLLTALTGSGMVFYDQAKGILTTTLGGGEAEVAPITGTGNPSTLATRQFADATPRLYIPPREPGDSVRIRLRQPGETHPNGRTAVSWDGETRQLTEASDPIRAGTGNRAADLLYPLHIGTIGGWPLRLLLLMSAILSVLATFWAVASYWRGWRKKRTQSRQRLHKVPVPRAKKFARRRYFWS